MIGRQYDYGRLYNRICIANIAARVCGCHAYEPNPNDVDKNDHSVTHINYLVDFTPEKWNKIIIQFQSLRGNLLRNDASLIVLPAQTLDESQDVAEVDPDELIPESDDRIDQKLEYHHDFSKEYDKMLESMKFHLCLSYIQPQLEKEFQKRSIDCAESIVISHEKIIAFE